MRERIAWPIWLWFMVLALDFAVVIAVGVALDDRELLVAFGALFLFTIYLWAISRLAISVGDGWLRVGRARIASIHISKVEILNEESMRIERGRNLDPRAFLALRFWVKGGVKVFISDERDPTPYWLVSMKHGDKLKAALAK